MIDLAKLSLPRKKKSYYVYWIKTGRNIYVGPYAKRSYAEKVVHKGDKIIRRKRGNSPSAV